MMVMVGMLKKCVERLKPPEMNELEHDLYETFENFKIGWVWKKLQPPKDHRVLKKKRKIMI